jgi:phage-related protein
VSVKPVEWLGSSRRDIQSFPSDARQVAGFQLYRVQQGLEPNDWKPLPNVGAGVKEIRIHTGLEHRVLCTANLADAVYVLHVFQKKARKTPKQDLDTARKRFRALLERQRRKNGAKKQSQTTPKNK